MKIIGLVRTLLVIVTSAVFCGAVMAQGSSPTELGGARVPPAGNSSVQTHATFAIGITTDNGLSWRNSVAPTDTLRLVGKVRPEASQIGQSADIYLLAKAGAVILMRRTDGAFEQWSGNLSELKPYRQQTRLAADTEIDLFTGQFGATGQFELFLGYRSTDGVLHYSPAPFNLNINTNPQGASSPWFFNGTVWQSNGTAPACQSPLLQAPFDLAKVTSILYPGQTRGGDYKAHGGFRLDGAGQTNQVTVMSALAGTVVRGVRDTAHGVVQYGFDIINPCGVMMRIGHLLELSPKFAAIADTLPPAAASNTFTELSGYTVSVGEPIATAIGLPGNVFMDFGIYDLHSRNPATTHMSGELRPYGICWLDAFSATDSARVRSLPAADGVSGTMSDYCR
ncbi:MAG: hypothetical protein V4751_13975 [Pseudomonadota bacterium]